MEYTESAVKIVRQNLFSREGEIKVKVFKDQKGKSQRAIDGSPRSRRLEADYPDFTSESHSYKQTRKVPFFSRWSPDIRVIIDGIERV